MSGCSEVAGEIHIEEVPGTFLPVLTPEMVGWWADVCCSLGRALGGGRLDPRVYENIVRTAAHVARFAPSDILLPDGCQRATFSMRQLAESMGLGGESTKGVQQAMRVLSLTTKPQDPVGYRKAHELLAAQRSSVPILECVEKSTTRGRASVWRLVGVKPRVEAGALSDPSWLSVVESSACVVETMEPVVRSYGCVVESSKPVVGQGVSFPTTYTRDIENVTEAVACGYKGNPCLDLGDFVVEKGAARQTEATTFSDSQLKVPLFARRDYASLISLFPCAPGKKEAETVRAYMGLLELGYTPRQLLGGVRRYFENETNDEKKRFPLVFLNDRGLVSSWCGRPKTTLDSKKLFNPGGPKGIWMYPGKNGMFAVEGCSGGSGRAEAYRALTLMPDLEARL